MSAKRWDVVVLRHQGTIDWLGAEFGELPPIIRGNATVADVAGKRVLGVLPLHLAGQAEHVTEVELTPPPRGEELTVEQVRERQPRLRTFVVREQASEIPTGSRRIQVRTIRD